MAYGLSSSILRKFLTYSGDARAPDHRFHGWPFGKLNPGYAFTLMLVRKMLNVERFPGFEDRMLQSVNADSRAFFRNLSANEIREGYEDIRGAYQATQTYLSGVTDDGVASVVRGLRVPELCREGRNYGSVVGYAYERARRSNAARVSFAADTLNSYSFGNSPPPGYSGVNFRQRIDIKWILICSAAVDGMEDGEAIVVNPDPWGMLEIDTVDFEVQPWIQEALDKISDRGLERLMERKEPYIGFPNYSAMRLPLTLRLASRVEDHLARWRGFAKRR